MIFCINYFNKKTIFFTNPLSNTAFAMHHLAHYINFFLLVILIIVITFLIFNLSLFWDWKKAYNDNINSKKEYLSMYVKNKISKFSHAPLLEFIWTIIPAGILIFMAYPSFLLLYSIDELIDPAYTIIVIGNQWYWTYEYSDFNITYFTWLFEEKGTKNIVETSDLIERVVAKREKNYEKITDSASFNIYNNIYNNNLKLIFFDVSSYYTKFFYKNNFMYKKHGFYEKEIVKKFIMWDKLTHKLNPSTVNSLGIRVLWNYWITFFYYFYSIYMNDIIKPDSEPLQFYVDYFNKLTWDYSLFGIFPDEIEHAFNRFNEYTPKVAELLADKSVINLLKLSNAVEELNNVYFKDLLTIYRKKIMIKNHLVQLYLTNPNPLNEYESQLIEFFKFRNKLKHQNLIWINLLYQHKILATYANKKFFENDYFFFSQFWLKKNTTNWLKYVILYSTRESMYYNLINLKEKLIFVSELLEKSYNDENIKLSYDSIIIPDEDLPLGFPRLLSVDQPLVLPINTPIRLLVTSNDVIHSWALPSHGIKIDAVPGRLNQVQFLTSFFGTSWGQCSELCGINHGFMPIEVRTIWKIDFISFIQINMQLKFVDYMKTFSIVIGKEINKIMDYNENELVEEWSLYSKKKKKELISDSSEVFDFWNIYFPDCLGEFVPRLSYLYSKFISNIWNYGGIETLEDAYNIMKIKKNYPYNLFTFFAKDIKKSNSDIFMSEGYIKYDITRLPLQYKDIMLEEKNKLLKIVKINEI